MAHRSGPSRLSMPGGRRVILAVLDPRGGALPRQLSPNTRRMEVVVRVTKGGGIDRQRRVIEEVLDLRCSGGTVG